MSGIMSRAAAASGAGLMRRALVAPLCQQASAATGPKPMLPGQEEPLGFAFRFPDAASALEALR